MGETGAVSGAPRGRGEGGGRPGGRGGGSGRRVEIGRVLFIQSYYMGDVILATPAVRAARRAFPGARLEFLTTGPGVGALEGNAHLDEVIRLERGVGAQMRLMRELRRRRYDAVVDFLSNPRTALLVAATGAAVRVGVRAGGPRDLAYTDLVPREPGPVYIARQKVRLLGPLGIDAEAIDDLSLEVAIGAAERAWAAGVWERTGLGTRGPVVAVSPVSRERFKQWGAERWAVVADRLAERGFEVLITNGPGEREQAAAVAERMRHRAVWDYGPTTVRQLAALYERCALWVGNDGGPKHVAVAAGTPTVTVIRWRLGPVWTDGASATPHVAIDRAPPQACDRRCARCEHLGCLGAVAAEDVVAAALEALGRVAPAKG